MRSKYGEVPDNNFSLNTTSVIYFWNPQAKSTSMKITPTFMITIRNLSIMEDVFQVLGGSKQQLLNSAAAAAATATAAAGKVKPRLNLPYIQSC